MHLIGRWEAIRGYDAAFDSWAEPYMLDRKWKAVKPYKCDEWWKSPKGVWMPTMRGGVVGIYGATQAHWNALPIALTLGSSNTWTTKALSSAYTNGSAGAAVRLIIRRAVAEGRTVTDIRFFITGFTGTASLVDDINYEIRSVSTTGSIVSGSNGTKNPASTTGWIAVTGLSVALSGNTFFLIIADADGGGTNFATINSFVNYATAPMSSGDSTDGFATLANNTGHSCLVVGFSDGGVTGIPYTALANTTSNTNRRGLYISDGFQFDVKLWGWISITGSANISGIEMYDSSANPGGSTLASGTDLITQDASATVGGALLSNFYKWNAFTPARFVFTYSASAAVPQKYSIGTGTDAVLRAGLPRRGAAYFAGANGTTNWSNDDTSGLPNMRILMEDIYYRSPHLVGGGMAGA